MKFSLPRRTSKANHHILRAVPSLARGHNEKDTNFVTAEQTVYHDALYPSHLLLPVIPEQEPKKK
jgi:predicted acyl esterase